MTDKQKPTDKKLSKSEQLAKIKADKKALNAQQKALRDELNENKSERVAARKEIASARKEARAQKTELRKLCASVNDVFATGDPKAINTLADQVVETSAALASAIRTFGEAADSLDEL